MGVMSRRVVPACSTLCYFCPSLRARSRQPVKRYKKLLAEIFQLPPDGEPNDRKINKLCEYASKNPTRIPKITDYLEQRCYKELRNEHVPLAKVVPCVYRKLLSSCKEQMPLLATSSLSIIRLLLDQTSQDELLVLGCLMLVDFMNNQVDSTYMFNLEGLIPKLCQLGQEIREDAKGLRLRSAALQALASLVQFMGDYSHISMDFDVIVSVIMDSYEANQRLLENGLQDMRLSQNQSYFTNEVVALDSTVTMPGNPAYWSRICLQNMATIAKEATTVRRVLDPLFRFFDNHNYWSPDNGIALSVLHEMQILMEKSDQNSHVLLSFTIKHLDHKSVANNAVKQINIVKVASHLARHAKLQASLAITAAISDLIRHLRKCMHSAIEASDVKGDGNKRNCALHSALEECLLQLTEKVGDVGPILDMLAVVLENLSPSAIVARATLSSVYRTAKIAASATNLSYDKKGFPEALFHQLLLAMTHPDSKTRIGSHRALSIILAPSVMCPWSTTGFPIPIKENDPHGALLVALSAFSSSESSADHFSNRTEVYSESLHIEVGTHNPQSHDRMNSKNEDQKLLRLNSHQVGLLLSSIWTQACSEDNSPANYEALGHTYNLALLCLKAKNSVHVQLIRCFQLAFSLRSMSLDNESILRPSHRRSLYTLASAMLVFSAKAVDLPQINPLLEATMSEKKIDPYLTLTGDNRLQATFAESGDTIVYGSEEDEIAASSFLATIYKDDKQLKETVVSYFREKFDNLPEKFVGIEEELLQEFSPDDSLLLGAPLFVEIPHSCPTYAQKDDNYFDEEGVPSLLEDEEILFEASGCQSDRKTSESVASSEVLSVNQLIESVLETAKQVSIFPVSSNPLPYDQMTSQCEALVVGKQQKMSVLLSFKHMRMNSEGSFEDNSINGTHQNEPSYHLESESKLAGTEYMRRSDSASSSSEHSFRLPPASPYDKFLIAAGC